MTRLLLAALVLSSAMGWGLWQRGRAVGAEAAVAVVTAERDALRAQRDAALAAAEVHRRAVLRLAQDAVRAQGAEDAARADPAGQVPASDFLRRVVGGL